MIVDFNKNQVSITLKFTFNTDLIKLKTIFYFLLFFTTPIKPVKPDTNNHIDAVMGTALNSNVYIR